jgi:GT2 family glycosyltransferase
MTLRCVRSVSAGEVIVVDDGSTDGTAELLTAEARVIRLDANSGFAKAANRGVSEARGDILLLLNSDAVMQPGALDALVAAFEDERLGVAGAQLLNEDGTLQWSGGPTPTLPWLIGVVSGLGPLVGRFRRRRAGSRVDWVSGAAMAFRAAVWRDAGPLDERFRFYCQDLEFCVRARAAGWEVRVIEEARVVHARGATIAAGSALRHDPAKLWPDLLDWARAGAFTRAVLVVAGTLRALLTRDPAVRRAVRAMRRS